ncbi:hypothetical protein ACFJGV_10245 [Cnuibacter sp. UC19_7]|uniref:hypothetical protein n=1 Tax=Cnuibacter sp. UC19_7 TaxID=3350166 RepID=UPI00366F1192
MTVRRRAGLSVVVLLALAATGCSQVAAIAPVGGGREAEARFGVDDVLIAEHVDVLTAPVCETDPQGAIRCAGTTTEDAEIVGVVPPGDPAQLSVTVGGETVYSGSLQSVLDDAVRATP